MRINYLGIIAGVLAFVSLALPWWTYSISSSLDGFTVSNEATSYLYQIRIPRPIIGTTVPPVSSISSPWYGLAALAFLVLGGLLGLMGGFIAKGRRIVLALGGTLALFSIIAFAAGLQNDISNGAVAGLPKGAVLFSVGSYNSHGSSFNYSCYLSFGFWLALIAALVMLYALTKERTLIANAQVTCGTSFLHSDVQGSDCCHKMAC